MEKYKLAKNTIIIKENNHALVFNSLIGNMFFLDQDEIDLLESFRKPKKINFEDKSKEIIENFISAYLIVKDDEEPRKYIELKNQEWVRSLKGFKRFYLLDLRISELCNFGCKHCFYYIPARLNKTSMDFTLMSFETAKKAVDFYLKFAERSIYSERGIHFGSAEPLLNYDVLKKIVLYAENQNPNITFALNTNLSLLNKEKAQFLKKHNIQITISIDGLQNANDKIRTFKDGSGTFSKIMEKVKMLQDLEYPIDSFNLLITENNFDLIDESVADWAKEEGFVGFDTDIDLVKTDEQKYTAEDYIDKIISIYDRCQKIGLENYGTWATAYINLVNGKEEDEVFTFCKALKGMSISVDPKENLFICNYSSRSVGNLSDINRIFDENSKYLQLINAHLPGRNPICYDCVIEGTCVGQCEVSSEVNISGCKNFRFLCDFYRGITLKLLKRKLNKEISIENLEKYKTK